MSEHLRDFLLVRVGPRLVGLRLEDVLEVTELGEVFPIPSRAPALRGVTSARGALVPLLHLGAFLEARSCPQERAETGVLAEVGGFMVCLEVDAADFVSRETFLPVPPGDALPWALAMVRRADGLVPILNLGTLRERLHDSGIRS